MCGIQTSRAPGGIQTDRDPARPETSKSNTPGQRGRSQPKSDADAGNISIRTKHRTPRLQQLRTRRTKETFSRPSDTQTSTLLTVVNTFHSLALRPIHVSFVRLFPLKKENISAGAGYGDDESTNEFQFECVYLIS